MHIKFHSLLFFLILLTIPAEIVAQHSVARLWNEALLDAIREDYARPTVHARNLFHSSVVMYDAWAVYDDRAATYLLGNTVGGFDCSFTGISTPADLSSARKEAISYAAYRLLSHRFKDSPGAAQTLARFNSLFNVLGYNSSLTSTDYTSGSPAQLGNYLAMCQIEQGFLDGSNEQNGYANIHYEPVNSPLISVSPGNPEITYPNRWQPLSLEVFEDQSGNIIPGDTTIFLSPEWGIVTPFALTEADLTVHEREGNEFWVYHDPGDPPYISPTGDGAGSEEYKWGFTLVAIWSSLLDPFDAVMIDISPASIGNLNIDLFPRSVEALRDFYNLLEGGDPGTGYAINPHTGIAYEEQIVPRGDYTRVLAEFWADGPDSETPPGHWFTLLNYVSDHPDLEKRFKGTGPLIDDLKWDVKAYFVLGGTVHDAAIASWGIKGWYDYVRPISAIRYMADNGQSTDTNLANYSLNGIPLIGGLIEVVQLGDPLEGDNLENVGKIKLYSWRAHDYIDDPEVDVAGVGWILAENWWPYQRPSFVTPPFAGYISGHSTYSRAAAEVLTLITGDAFFPGGLGIFNCQRNEFLVFEEGPSIDLTLQWATYRDASDQCSLSRIFGGIHPPADDIPGRLIGEVIGTNAVAYAEKYFSGEIIGVSEFEDGIPNKFALRQNYPNPFNPVTTVKFSMPKSGYVLLTIYNLLGEQIVRLVDSYQPAGVHIVNWDASNMVSGIYIYRLQAGDFTQTRKMVLLK